MAVKTLMSASEFLKYAANKHCELVSGEVIDMSPPGFRHGLVSSAVIFQLRKWSGFGREALGFVASNDAGVITHRDPDSVRGPDCLFVQKARIPADFDSRGYLTIAPDLAVEILSPTDRWSEVIAKVGEYLEAGVREVWVIDPELSQVEVFRPDAAPKTYRANDELSSVAVLPGFRCSVADLFTEV